jgi:hypothetical protein
LNTKQIDASIENILDSDHTNAQLWRSILGYFRKIFSSQNSQVDVTTLGKWLLNNHPPFRKNMKIPT